MYCEVNSERWLSLQDFPNERWVDIKGYEGLYQVSDYGRVKSLERYVCKSHKYNSKILKQSKDKDGYLKLTLSKNKNKKMFYVHRLVGNAFVYNPENKPLFNHLDIVTKYYCNNHYTNLEAATYSENIKYAYKIGSKKPSKRYNYKKGIENKQSILINQYSVDGNFIKTWYCINDIERCLGFLHSNIISCCKGRYKQAYGYVWKYKEVN